MNKFTQAALAAAAAVPAAAPAAKAQRSALRPVSDKDAAALAQQVKDAAAEMRETLDQAAERQAFQEQLQRKLQEMRYAIAVNKKYSKDENFRAISARPGVGRAVLKAPRIERARSRVATPPSAACSSASAGKRGRRGMAQPMVTWQDSPGAGHLWQCSCIISFIETPFHLSKFMTFCTGPCHPGSAHIAEPRPH